MNLMIQPNQICLIVKLYNNRPELLPDSNDQPTQNFCNYWALSLIINK